MVILRPEETGLKELLDRVLDKGVAVDLSVRVDLGSVDFLGAKGRIIITSLKTAERIGLGFPEGTDLDTPAWRSLRTKQPCPVCGMESRPEGPREEGCPWCGWNYRPNEG